MNSREDIIQQIINRSENMSLQSIQVAHLRSEMTIQRLMRNEISLDDTILETAYLDCYSENQKKLIATGWLPSDLKNSPDEILDHVDCLTELFRANYLSPLNAKAMCFLFPNGPSGKNLMQMLVSIDIFRQGYINIFSQTPMTEDVFFAFYPITIKLLLEQSDKIILLFKYNALTTHTVTMLNEKNVSAPFCGSFNHSLELYINTNFNALLPKIKKDFYENYISAVLTIGQGTRTEGHPFATLPMDMINIILGYLHPFPYIEDFFKPLQPKLIFHANFFGTTKAKEVVASQSSILPDVGNKQSIETTFISAT